MVAHLVTLRMLLLANSLRRSTWQLVALVIGVDRLLDMLRTVTNVTGDCAVSCVVAKSENALDQTIYDDPRAGSVEAATRDSLPSAPTP